ncbi:MAG TPA: adenylate/guanylate cyclase domain-containing protein, partial [Spirochaetota bacterium]|nr:adenylate/guanylate cyclase domain-containing protein [Spirochaetota bacterium]
SLEGEWEFYWMTLTEPGKSVSDYTHNMRYYDIPGTWNSDISIYPPHGYATLRLTVLLPDHDQVYALYIPPMLTAYSLWIDGKIISFNGKIGINGRDSSPQYMTKIAPFKPESDKIEIVCQISNYHYRKGGMWSPILIGHANRINRLRDLNVAIALFLCGAFIIMALYHIGIYIFRPQELSSLFFALFCLTFTIRIITTGEILLSEFITDINWGLLIKLELMPLFFGGPVFLQFFKTLFPKDVGNIIRKTIIYSALAIGAFIIILPVSYASYLVPPLEVIIVLGMLYITICLIKALRLNRPGAKYMFFAFIIFFATAINDILFALEFIQTSYMLPFGLFIFILAESFLLAKNIARSYTNVELLSGELHKTNRAMSRFVPNEFLAFLNKKSIMDIRLGDQHLQFMTILFCDIRSFTTLSEKMSPQQNFNFLNSYLKKIGPVIRKNNGFIDKYIGDEIMALFPNSASDAVKTAVEIFTEIKSFNITSVSKGFPPINVGVGIHTGNIMLGIIGEDQRIESTVISDTVNLASRIEKLTRLYKTDILVTGKTLTKLDNLGRLHVRMIDIVQVRGKTEESAIFEIYDSNDYDTIAIKDKTKEELEYAINLYFKADFIKSLELLEKILNQNPNDGVVNLYIKRCKKYIELGTPANWTGVSRFEG